MKKKLSELVEELQAVFFQKYKVIDFVLPPLFFWLSLRLFGFASSLILSLSFVLVLLAWRLKKGESLWSLLFGFLGIIAAIFYANRSGNSAGFFLPDIATDGLLALACLVSVLIKKPLVAYTSFISRRWPLAWYWHPRVRPAYCEVTLIWFVFFLLKFISGYWLFNYREAEKLALLNLLTGWPAILVLLIISYLYGLKRLRNLKGPSVEEFKKKKKPPWQGQKQGF